MNRFAISTCVPAIVLVLHGCASTPDKLAQLEKSISSSAVTSTLKVSADRVSVGKGEDVDFVVTFLNPWATTLPLPVEGPSPDNYDRIQYSLSEKWYRRKGDAEGISSSSEGVSAFYPAPPTTEPVLELGESRSYRLKWKSTYDEDGYVVLAFDFNRSDDPPPLTLVLRTTEPTNADAGGQAR